MPRQRRYTELRYLDDETYWLMLGIIRKTDKPNEFVEMLELAACLEDPYLIAVKLGVWDASLVPGVDVPFEWFNSCFDDCDND